LTETVNNTLKKIMLLQSGNEDLKSLWLCLGYLWNFYKCCNSLTKMVAETDQIIKIKRMIQSSQTQLTQLQKLTNKTSSPFLEEAFDNNINRNLFGNSPVRKVQFQSLDESLSNLLQITNEFNIHICDFLSTSTSYLKTRNMLRQSSSWECNILTRSILILNLYFNDLFLGRYNVIDFVSGALNDEAGLPLQNDLSTFINRLGKPIYDWLKLFLLNKNRQREFIETFIFREWSNLQKDVIPVTTSSHLTNFILYTSMDIMDHFHMLSLKIKLVHGHYDYSIAYWYRTFILSAMINLYVGMMKEKKIEERKNQRKKNGEEEDAQLLILGLRRSLCRGMAQYITALYQSNYLTKPQNYEFTTHAQRFSKRFEPFAQFPQPPHLSYSDFLQGTDYTNVSPQDLISSSRECFKTAKMLGDKLLQMDDLPRKEVLGLVKVCVGNLLYLHVLGKEIEGGKRSSVKFDFEADVQFCIIQLVHER